MKTTALVLVCVIGMGSSVAIGQNLYQPASYRSLAGDKRAYRPGDVLTVLVVENASASATADTNAAGKSGVGVGVNAPNTNKAWSLDLNSDYTGGGRIQRTGRVLAQITVTVQEVDANGQLWIKGEQLIEVNSEKQEIRLEGRVRPLDVADNNTVSSTRIADARISYVGKGVLGERQSPGLVSRLLGWLGLL